MFSSFLLTRSHKKSEPWGNRRSGSGCDRKSLGFWKKARLIRASGIPWEEMVAEDRDRCMWLFFLATFILVFFSVILCSIYCPFSVYHDLLLLNVPVGLFFLFLFFLCFRFTLSSLLFVFFSFFLSSSFEIILQTIPRAGLLQK